MFTRPADLTDRRVAEVVRSGWSLAVDEVEYAPVGFGSHHWIVTDAERRWFVTVDAIAAGDEHLPDRLRSLQAAISTARLLRDLGLGFVVAPVAATGGELLVPIDGGYVAAVYLYVDGDTHGWGAFPDRASRVAVLDRLVALHTAPIQARLHALADRFEIPCRNLVEAALAGTSGPWNGGPFAEPTRRLLARHGASISGRLAHYDHLVEGVADRTERFVITHGEPHRGNTITTPDGVVVVDWDTVLLAPPERDLWWLTREDETMIEDYEQRTGISVDAGALELYRIRWDLVDLALYAAQFRQPHADSEDTHTAWDALTSYLDDGHE